MPDPLSIGTGVTVRLEKQDREDVQYPGRVTFDDGTHLVVEARWSLDQPVDLGPVCFEPGDTFVEHYWRDRWYTIFEVHARSGSMKGWYANVARPVVVRGDMVHSADLELDVWVSADRQTVVVMDVDEFASSGLAERDPQAARAALEALGALRLQADDGFRALLTAPAVPACENREHPTGDNGA